MEVAVLGAGNGGCGVAFDWAQHGHNVRLFATAEYPGEVAAIAERGEIVSTGELSGAAPISYAGHDAGRALSGADLIMVVGPAYATEGFALAAAPHLTPEQAIVVCPTSCLGSFAFRRAAGLSRDDDRYLVGETSTLPYAVRMSGPATIHVFVKLRAGLWVAATPRGGTDRLRTMLGEVYPGIDAAGSVLATTLQNGNPVIHPAVTLCNAALIERTGGDFNFYEDGITPAVGRLMQAVDSERMAIAATLGHAIASDPAIGVMQGYMVEENYDTGYSTAPGFRGIRAQSALNNRYLTEDVGYSMVLFTELARAVGVPTPTMDALIQTSSALLGRDFRREAPRTLASLGLSDLDAAGLAKL